jgi:hypothetical protein
VGEETIGQAPSGETSEPGPQVPEVSFVSDMHLLTNRFLWWDFSKVIVFSVAGMWLAVFFMSLIADPSEPVLLPPAMVAVTAGVFVVLLVLACLVLGNRFSYDVSIGPDGVSWAAGSRERKINRVVFVLNLLSGKPGAIGASMLATAEESGGIPWAEVRRANLHTSPHVISLRDSWHVVQRLYVPEPDWDRTVSAVQAGLSKGERQRAGQEAREVAHPSPKRNWWAVAGWGLFVVVAGVVSAVWDLMPDEARFPLVFAVVALILAVVFEGPLRRMMALLGVGFVGWFALMVAAEALSTFDSMFTGAATPTWTLETPQLAVAAAGTSALLLFGAWRLFGRGWPAVADAGDGEG